MSQFKTISEIETKDPNTWSNHIFLTFDTDWAHSEYISFTLDLLEEFNVKSTWFITEDFKNKSQILNRMVQSDFIEIGIHPNFNPMLLEKEATNRSPREVVSELLEIAPDAKSVRSHALTQNTRLSKLFWEMGLKYECNTLIPEKFGITPSPWITPTQIIHVPHIWADDFACSSSFDFDRNPAFIPQGGLTVFDFHPIHVFLNTRDISLYEETRAIHQKPDLLYQYINKEIGTMTYLRSILEEEYLGTQATS